MPFVEPLEQAEQYLDVICYKVLEQHLQGKLFRMKGMEFYF